MGAHWRRARSERRRFRCIWAPAGRGERGAAASYPADALPDGYSPADLLSASANGIPSAGLQLVRTLILDDTRAMVQAAANDGQQLYVGSGVRMQAFQVDVLGAQGVRWGDQGIANRYAP